MRDAQRLRSQIAMLACLAGPASCSSPPSPQAAAAQEKQAEPGQPRESARDRYYREKAEREGKPVEAVVPPAMKNEADARRAAASKADAEPKTKMPPPPQETGDDRFAAFPGDPPYIDGYNPEEETCPSGNWCGPKSAASDVGVGEATEDTLGCPSRIGGGRRPDREATVIEGPVYAGLSAKPNMQGSFNTHGTELRRADGDDDACCYHWFEYCSGRPHLGADGPVQADVRAAAGATGWASETRPVLDRAFTPLRARIAEAWRQDAQAEHASVAAFARATLELMAVGAPPELLEGCQRAALDEIDHARRCFALAATYGGEEIEPDGLPALAPRRTDLSRLAADTFAEGCVGESIAALVAERALRHCLDPAVRDALATIAADEARHAALAWATLRWAVDHGGDAVRDAVRERAALLRGEGQRGALPPVDPEAAALAQAGRLDPRALAEASRDAWLEIVDPMLRTALA